MKLDMVERKVAGPICMEKDLDDIRVHDGECGIRSGCDSQVHRILITVYIARVNLS